MAFNESDIGKAVVDLIRSELRSLHICTPARVESFDYANHKATVTPLLKRSNLKGVQSSFSPIPDVPVVFPASGAASVTFPINAGDTVLLLFADRSLENWIDTGAEAATEYDRMFDLSDAIAIAGLFPNSHDSDAANNSDLQIKLGSQKITIKANGNIEIGASTLQALMTEAYKTALSPYLTALQTLALAVGTLVPATAAAAITAFNTSYPSGFIAPANSLTSKAKAQ